MMRTRTDRAHAGETHGIDLAPMLDFVLNLLIFFIIAAVFTKELGLPLNRPGRPDGSGGKVTPISITATNEIYVDGRLVDLRAVRANVERLRSADPETGVLIVADRNAETGTLTQVVDQVRLGGTYNITFSTN
jgi:biopolymer transport protein ExbD